MFDTDRFLNDAAVPFFEVGLDYDSVLLGCISAAAIRLA